MRISNKLRLRTHNQVGAMCEYQIGEYQIGGEVMQRHTAAGSAVFTAWINLDFPPGLSNSSASFRTCGLTSPFREASVMRSCISVILRKRRAFRCGVTHAQQYAATTRSRTASTRAQSQYALTSATVLRSPLSFVMTSVNFCPWISASMFASVYARRTAPTSFTHASHSQTQTPARCDAFAHRKP